MTVKVEAEALDTSLTQRGSQWPVSSGMFMRTVEQNETAYGLNTIRARPVSLVQVRHAWRCLLGRERSDVAGATLRGNHADMFTLCGIGASLTHDTQRGVSSKAYLYSKLKVKPSRVAV